MFLVKGLRFFSWYWPSYYQYIPRVRPSGINMCVEIWFDSYKLCRINFKIIQVDQLGATCYQCQTQAAPINRVAWNTFYDISTSQWPQSVLMHGWRPEAVNKLIIIVTKSARPLCTKHAILYFVAYPVVLPTRDIWSETVRVLSSISASFQRSLSCLAVWPPYLLRQ